MNRSEKAEVASLLVWLERHPSYVLTGHATVIVECETCGDSTRTSDEVALSGLPCRMCESTMRIGRYNVSQRVRKNPYSYGRGYATAPPPCGAWPENLLG